MSQNIDKILIFLKHVHHNTNFVIKIEIGYQQ